MNPSRHPVGPLPNLRGTQVQALIGMPGFRRGSEVLAKRRRAPHAVRPIRRHGQKQSGRYLGHAHDAQPPLAAPAAAPAQRRCKTCNRSHAGTPVRVALRRPLPHGRSHWRTDQTPKVPSLGPSPSPRPMSATPQCRLRPRPAGRGIGGAERGILSARAPLAQHSSIVY